MNDILIFLFAISNIVFSQINFNSSLNVNYGSGYTYNYKINEEVQKDDFDFSQTLYEVNMYSGSWSLNSKIEFSDPPEIGTSFKGIRRLLINYKKDNSEFYVGDIYRSWGKGLVLNQYDDISIGYDNGIRGAAIVYNNNKTDVEFLTGIKKIQTFSNNESFSRKPTKSTSNNLIGIYLKKRTGKLDIGFTSLKNKEKFALSSFTIDSSIANHNLNSIFGNYINSNIDISFEYAQKHTSINPYITEVKFDLDTFTSDTSFRKNYFGHGLALSSNYSFGNLNFSFDYAYYSFFVTDPQTEVLEPYPERIISFQKPMITNQEHSSILLNRLTYQQNENDQVGLNMLINISLGQSSSLSLNKSYSSKSKKWYKILNNNQSLPGPWIKEKKDYIFPSNHPSTTPYVQNTLFFESFFEKGYFQILISGVDKINYIYENIIGDSYSKERFETEKALTIPMSLDYNFSKDYVFFFNVGLQKVEKGIESRSNLEGDSFTSFYINDNGDFVDFQYTNALSFGISKSSKWSLQINLESDKYNEVGTISNNIFLNPLEKLFKPILENYDKKWISFELNYRFEHNLQFALFYGSNKGGVSCANGICRYYPGFSDGLRVKLTKSFF